MTKTLVVLDTGNSKTGRSTVTYRTQDTCPTSCAFYMAGCYARGRIFAVPEHHGTVDDGAYTAVRALVNLMPAGRLMRANVSGDVLDDTGELDRGYVDALSHVATERPDVDVFTYTHAWRQLSPDLAPNVTVNASTETAAGIEAAAAAGWPTVVTVPEHDPESLIGQTIAGRKVVQCPAQTKGLTCEQCRLCARPNRKSTVAFVAHGSGKAIVSRSIAAARAAESPRALPVFTYPEATE